MNKKLARIKQVLLWPSKPNNNYAPWFKCLWRMIFVPFIYIGLSIAFIGVLCSYGMYEAVRFWKMAT